MHRINVKEMLIASEIHKLKAILESFLGDSKRELDDSFQLQFACPRCIEAKGEKERSKFNLEINLKKGVFNCWSCGQYDDEMHGSIKKLIKLYGNEEILNDYKQTVDSFKNSKLYDLSFCKNDFNIEIEAAESKEVELPTNFSQFKRDDFLSVKPLKYLEKRGITIDIVKKFSIGYTKYDKNFKQLSSRIIIPSFNEFGEINYWTGRDFTGIKGRQKYYNPVVERKNLIFNEDKVIWDADITLVEGPFDHIVVPNSIPLLGKALKEDFKLYQKLITKANANINIFLDGDAFEDVKKIYQLLNHNRLYNKIRFIPTREDEDPSSIFEKYGKIGIAKYLGNSQKINEIYLI